ncbi:MAG: hypothetical protein LUE64_01295 [Candidatus Gastranaerophilales bacterium]|nr:hypothetical protein [Candidatus Gastranaerophilales bacterium]
MKKNILQTFEDFLREPLCILKKTIITIAGIETADVAQRSISVQTTDDGNIQINVINSKNAYHLLSSVVYKRQISELRHLINENKKREIYKKFTRPQIGTNI